ncbi:MAG: hypothetical protein ACPGZP_11075 [Panacagrimonas sp.]
MNVGIKIERSIELPVPVAQSRQLIQDYQVTFRRFPKLRKLTRLGEHQYRWDMSTIGSRMARIAHDVSYGAHYQVDAHAGELVWSPLSGVGNASIKGRMRVTPSTQGSRLSLAVSGQLYEVPIPLMYRVIAPSFIEGKFTAMVDGFLQNSCHAARTLPASAD